jgi:hypothetical protein
MLIKGKSEMLTEIDGRGKPITESYEKYTRASVSTSAQVTSVPTERALFRERGFARSCTTT